MMPHFSWLKTVLTLPRLAGAKTLSSWHSIWGDNWAGDETKLLVLSETWSWSHNCKLNEVFQHFVLRKETPFGARGSTMMGLFIRSHKPSA